MGWKYCLFTLFCKSLPACGGRQFQDHKKKLWSDHDNTWAEVSSCVGTFMCRGHDCYQIKLLISNSQKQI